MLFRRRRHRRWIALIALLGLLFQQLAMAAYVCPLESGDGGNITASSDIPPCHTSDDQARCHQHCHPLQLSLDHPSNPTVAALLPATTWLYEPVHRNRGGNRAISFEVIARATAPPLNIQHCTFQI